MENVAKEYDNRIAVLKNLLCETHCVVEKHTFPKNSDEALKYEDIVTQNFEPGDCYVYIIFWVNGSAKEMADKFQKEKNKGGYSLPRNNYNFKKDSEYPENKCFDENKVLYVGSSKDIKTRLEQHFSDKSPTTYALHLSTWEDGKNDLGNFRVFAVNLSADLKCVEDKDKRFALTIIEDILADIYKPLLGKRGPNTK